MRWALVALVAAWLCAPALAGVTRPGDPRREGRLKVGDPAPDFELKRLEGDGTVKLSSFRDKSPVVLIFGSYT